MNKFPKNFLFGAATSAHQIEGGNFNSDWYEFEKSGHTADGKTSDPAADSWHKWSEDIELLKKTNLNAYRFGFEWAKIEPEEGKFNQTAIEHYREILQTLKKNNIKVMITLWHFTLPLWLADQGGFANKKIIPYFVRYCKKMIEEFADLVDLWATLNEPNVYTLKGYIEGEWVPGHKNDLIGTVKVWNNLITCHNEVYKHIKKAYPNIQIGAVINVAAFEPYKNWLINRWLANIISFFDAGYLIKKINKQMDFLGLNYYMKFIINFLPPFRMKNPAPKNDFGWSINQEGLEIIIKENTHWQKPIYITENGIADSEDKYRAEFIEDALGHIADAIKNGADVRGYFHWSLLDNFEWAAGYTQKFGLFTIDRQMRPSAQKYAELVKKYQAD